MMYTVRTTLDGLYALTERDHFEAFEALEPSNHEGGLGWKEQAL